MLKIRFSLPALLLCAGVALATSPTTGSADSVPPIQLFVDAASEDEETARAAMATLSESWRDGYACLLVDLARFMRPRQASRLEGGLPGGPGSPGRRGSGGSGGAGTATVGGGRGAGGGGGDSQLPTLGALPRQHPSTKARARLVRFLEEQTGQDFGDDLLAWRRWHWNLPYEPHPGYAAFKAALYGRVDKSLGLFFEVGGGATVRLDEIDWSGRPPTRIPMLDHPKHIPTSEAEHVEHKHIVFGLEVGGEARAYPRRMLAWHELTRDRLGETEITLVYDPLSGAAIPYASKTRGALLSFRPTGLVYRSNLLMFDEETVSLWSTLDGRPVLGPLTAHHVQLRPLPVVTTTWREWTARHPDTTVLSPDTGYPFDYSWETPFEHYGRSDRLMFEVPQPDDRLEDKEPVLALTLPAARGAAPGERDALAIKASLLEKRENRVYHTSLSGLELVVVTSDDGAHRVYAAGDTRFVGLDREGRILDANGGLWTLTETALVPEAREATGKMRLPAWRSFWFAWHAQYPDTELEK